MRLLVIALAVLAAAWVVANIFLFLLPFVLGLFGIIFVVGVVKSALGAGRPQVSTGGGPSEIPPKAD